MGCICFKDKEIVMYLNNRNNFSVCKNYSFTAECYDDSGRILKTKRFGNNVLESFSYDERLSNIKIFVDRDGEKVFHQDFNGPFRNGKLLDINRMCASEE